MGGAGWTSHDIPLHCTYGFLYGGFKKQPPPPALLYFQAYSVCEVGGPDSASALGPIVKGRGLERLVAARALEQEPRQALRVRGRLWGQGV